MDLYFGNFTSTFKFGTNLITIKKKFEHNRLKCVSILHTWFTLEKK